MTETTSAPLSDEAMLLQALAEAAQASPSASAFEMPAFDPPQPEAPPAHIALDLPGLLGLEVPIIVQLAHRRMALTEVLHLRVGSIIEFVKSADEELDLMINNKIIGTGNAVKVGENFGIKISAINPPQETIRKLGHEG